jgi:hypothetical protein
MAFTHGADALQIPEHLRLDTLDLLRVEIKRVIRFGKRSAD